MASLRDGARQGVLGGELIRDTRNDEDTRSLLAVLYEGGHYDEAERLSLHLLQVRPNDVALLDLLGNCALHAGQCEQALALVDRFDPPHGAAPEAWALRGDSYGKLNLLEKALDSYDRAIAARPDHAQAYSRRGLILLKQRDYRAALASCTKATAIDPELAETWAALARIFGKLKHHDLAAGAYRRALAIEPRMAFVKGRLLQHMLSACDWRNVGPLIEEIEQDMLAGREAARPFAWQVACSSPRSLQLCAAAFHRTRRHASREPAARVPGACPSRLRVGYVSGELRDHSTAYLRVGVFEHHDKSRFEIVAFDNGWDDGGPTRSRINAAMCRIISIAGTTDAQAASIIRDQAIDILVDMNGFYGLHRMGVFALRPAPLQVTFPGYPGTLGAPFIDYIIADDVVLPAIHQRFFAEQPAYLPHSYQPNDNAKPISTRAFKRQELGLPADAFVFCCFNNNHKILPAMFDVWVRILHAVPGSVLWLLADNQIAAANLRKEARARGLDPMRLVLAQRMAVPDHLARQRCADLFLDTLPYNAHTTASDALWAGLPLLTCLGEAFAGRVAASLLRAIGLPELVTDSIEEYEREAVSLARSPGRLAFLRERLARNRLSMPLFDTPLFTRHLEAAYLAMYDRHRAGLPPEPIAVT